MTNKSGKIIKVVAIIFMAMTAAMNLLGGSGTTCAAFLTENFPSMSAILDYQWLYQIFMVTTVLTGIAGIWVTIKLIRGGANSYKNSLIILGIGSAIGLAHFITSQTLRGAAAPANVKFYINFATLILFLLLKLPGLWERVDFTNTNSSKGTSGGLAAFVSGVLVLSTFVWAAPSHTYRGDNWVLVLEFPLLVSGSLLALGGLVLLVRSLLTSFEMTPMNTTIEALSGD
jgi:hypothetical protein